MNPKPTLSSFQFVIYVSGGFAMNLTNLVLSQWLYERFVIGGVFGSTALSLIFFGGCLTGGVFSPFFTDLRRNSYTPFGAPIPCLVFSPPPLALFPFFFFCHL